MLCKQHLEFLTEVIHFFKYTLILLYQMHAGPYQSDQNVIFQAVAEWLKWLF